MRRGVVVLSLSILVVGALAVPSLANADTVSEVEQAVRDGFAYGRENNRSEPDEISAEGSVEFWSSGGLLIRGNPGAEPQEWESFNLHAKHIEVVSLVEGEVALVTYYSEGSMQPKGNPAVPHYLTRVMEVYVKEDGKWKRRAGHWSAINGGAGTSQSVE